MKQPRWIIVSNRLPISYEPEKHRLKTSSGGLVTAIKSIRSKAKRVWVGCAPENITPDTWEKLKKDKKKVEGLEPIFTAPDLYDRYYNGFCNDLLWPLMHYETERITYTLEDWEAYVRINKEFAKKILEISSTQDDVIWIHDFHLFLVPRFLKEARKTLKVGFFLHIPFPSSEIFRQFPKRHEVLEGLLSADLIGFHDYSYLRHFRSCLSRILGVESNFLSVSHKGNESQLGVFPVSIDTNKIATQSQKPEIKKKSQELKSNLFTFLGVDRLDYIKGIDLKLQSYRIFLQRYPEMRGKVQLVQIAVPTRIGVSEYMELKQELDQLVGEINGAFGTSTWTPIKYIYNHLELSELLALYNSADSLLITSKRDGMNLVTLEYIASQSKNSPGVVLLSEFTGAHSMLAHTFPVNPWDSEDTAKRMRQATQLPKDQRQERWEQMFSYLKEYTATHWAESFIQRLTRNDLSRAPQTQEFRVNKSEVKKICRLIKKQEGNKILFLDYDGTLVPIVDDPDKATLPKQTFQLLKALSRKGLEIVIVSGRPGKFLKEQFGGDSFVLASEHGAQAFHPKRKKWWRRVNPKRETWQSTAINIMEDYSRRVPNSFVERKSYAVAWHYRKSPEEYGHYQALKLQEELESVLVNQPVSVLLGKKVLEVRSLEANKGAFASHYLESFKDVSWAMAIGDDRTDEDLFNTVKERGISFKVGQDQTNADFSIENQEQVILFLKTLYELLD